MCVGNISPLLTYFCQNIDLEAGDPWSTNLMDDVTTFLWKGIGPPIMYEYRPEICVCKPTFTYGPTRNGHYIMPAGGKFLGNMTQKYINWGGVATQEDAPTQNDYVTGKQIPYNSFLEQYGIVTRGVSNSQGCFMAPTLHIGAFSNLWTLRILKMQMNMYSLLCCNG